MKKKIKQKTNKKFELMQSCDSNFETKDPAVAGRWKNVQHKSFPEFMQQIFHF